MEVQLEHSASEIKRLQRCINDLVSLLALPAIWSRGDPSQVLHTLFDALMRMLSLNLVSVQLTNLVGETPVEMVRVANWRGPMPPTHEICEALSNSLQDNSQKWPPMLRKYMGEGDVSIVPLPLGFQGEFGTIFAAAQRADFPQQTEALLLNVAASQALFALQEARFRNQQKRIAEELDRRVAQRTAELAAVNAALQLQVGMLQHLPVSTWTLKPDGTPDFVNEVWLEFSGQTLDFVRSHPEAWMTAVHPEDRETASRAFWDGVRSGRDFAFETRSRGAQDGTYRWHLQQAVALRDAEGKVLKFVGTTTDIDDQKRAQEVLRASESNLREILDGIPGLVTAISPAGVSEVMNRPFLEFFGKTAEEMKNWKTVDVIHPDDLPRVIAEFTHSLATGTLLDLEVRYHRADGVYRWSHLRVHPARDADGRITGWYSLITDIEDQKRAEAKLRESEINLKQIINTIPTPAWSARPDGYCEFVNQRWLDFTGLSAEQGVGWGWGAAIHPEDLPGLVAYWQTCLASGTPVDTEARMRRFDGVYRWFLFRANPLRDEAGNIIKWYGTNTDIDDRKCAEEKLRRSEALLAQVQSVSLTGGFSWRVDTDEVTFSEEAYRIFEFEKGTPVALQQIASRVHPEDIPLLSEKMAGARSGGGDQDYETRLRMPDGSVRYLHTISHGTRDSEGRLEYIGAVQDITRRKASEEALNKARSDLAHVSRVTSLGALTASIAHEVNQPLSGIITNASTCLRMLATDPPQLEGARETARRTIRDGNRMSEVITRLRALFSKKDAATESVNLNDAVLDVIALSIVELQKNRVMLRPELADNLPLVTGDRVQLQQVILNLLRNGSDAMSTVEDRPRQLVIRTERDEGDRVRLTVKDAGVGFDPQAVDRLFDAFYSTKGDGMGIGLSVSRSIIESHHGRLWATLNDGPGATFSFSIPRVPEGLARADAIRSLQAPPKAVRVRREG
jgi:PAS domain S-box-containing protein